MKFYRNHEPIDKSKFANYTIISKCISVWIINGTRSYCLPWLYVKFESPSKTWQFHWFMPNFWMRWTFFYYKWYITSTSNTPNYHRAIYRITWSEQYVELPGSSNTPNYSVRVIYRITWSEYENISTRL